MLIMQCRENTVGVTVMYKLGRKLVGDRTAKSRLEDIQVTESQFADDVAVYATTREGLETAATEFMCAASKWGLTVSTIENKRDGWGKRA